MRRGASWTLGVLLVLLFGVGIWFRITSLEAMPDIDSDEAWYGVQAYRLGHGQPFEATTPNSNPLNPLHTGLEVLLLLAFDPAYWILRAPAVLAGVLTIALTYRLGLREFGRRAALIASALVTVLPIAILTSRKGYDCSTTPLMSLLLLYFAYKGRVTGMLLSAVGCFLSHPTTIFLFPIVAPVYFVASWLRLEGSPGGRRLLVVKVGVCALVVLACGLMVLFRPRTQLLISTYSYGGLSRLLFLGQGGGLARAELSEFLSLYAKLFLGCGAFGLPPGPWQDYCFWGVFLAAVVPGTFALWRDRRWGDLALTAGLFLGASALFVAVGAAALRLDANRYGLFLVMPTLLVFALAVDRLMVAPTTRPRTALLAVECVALLLMGGALLVDFQVLCFDANRGGSREERIWTLQNDAADAKRRAMQLIERDRDRGRVAADRGKTIVFAEDWWTWWSLEYIAVARRDIEFRSYDVYYNKEFWRFREDFLAAIREGRGYAVGFKGKTFEDLMRSGLAPDPLKEWELVRYGNAPAPVSFSGSVLVFRGRRTQGGASPTRPLEPPPAMTAGAPAGVPLRR